MIFLIQHLFYFRLQYQVFTSSYFKYEGLALNSKIIKRTRHLWRYTTPFIFFLSNKTDYKNTVYFKLLKSLGINIFFIIDPVYHKGTLQYCQKYKFVTVGPVAISSNFYTLNFPIPVAANSVFSNLFCLRLLFKLEQEVSLQRFYAIL